MAARAKRIGARNDGAGQWRLAARAGIERRKRRERLAAVRRTEHGIAECERRSGTGRRAGGTRKINVEGRVERFACGASERWERCTCQ